jgi:3-hydroxymyristoyl/3-hydroxydecanoyl-(acyl carrier protein) dehydratase
MRCWALLPIPALADLSLAASVDRFGADLMVTLPEVLAVERQRNDLGEEVRLSLRIPPELAWFVGHFPGTPLLPGLVQTHWIVEFARQHYELPPHFLSMTNMKFMRLILPDARVDLRIRYVTAKGELSFEYREATAICASGRMRFGDSPGQQLRNPLLVV